MKSIKLILFLWGCILISCAQKENADQLSIKLQSEENKNILNAGFVCVEKVYNSELMAPYDILQHTVYRDSSNYIRCFIVTQDGKPFTTSEGILITPHYSFDNCPPIDILLIPSSENSVSSDLKNKKLMNWIKEKVISSKTIITLCDGAFPLAATGVLDNRIATTFPGDRERFAKMFPNVDVRYDVNFVEDGKYITSVGGALSYEPALYLIEKLYSKASAHRTGQGLVLDWDLQKIPHLLVNPE
jgi:transcriptional regulator GlxA family with amidase domain